MCRVLWGQRERASNRIRLIRLTPEMQVGVQMRDRTGRQGNSILGRVTHRRSRRESMAEFGTCQELTMAGMPEGCGKVQAVGEVIEKAGTSSK